MKAPIYIPIRPGTEVAAVEGWNSPSYTPPPDLDPDYRAVRTDDLVVVDCRSEEAVEQWMRREPSAATTPRVRTPQGVQFYYELPRPGLPGLQSGPLVDEIDIKTGIDSYVLAPGSLHPSGGRHEWVDDSESRQPETLPSLVTKLVLRRASRVSDRSSHGSSAPLVAKGISELRLLYSDSMPDPPPIEWWWKPYVPKGRLVMLDGEEGIGKGLFAVQLAIASITGRGFPSGGSVKPEPVLWLSAEDDPGHDILRRLQAAGYKQNEHVPVTFVDPAGRFPTAPTDIEELKGLVLETGARFVILDPGRSFLRSPDGRPVNFNDEATVRPGLEALNHLAHVTGCTMVFVHHWNKSRVGSTRDKMGGSVAFLQVVRHRITLARVGAERAFSVEKSNVIDSGGTVHDCRLQEEPQLQSARLEFGQRLPEFQDLDEWIASHAEGGRVVLDRTEEVLEWMYEHVVAGERVPNRDELKKKVRSASLADCQSALTQCVEQGLATQEYDRGPRIWVGS